MPLMKAHTAPRSQPSAIVMDLSDLEREASQIVARASAEADRIIAHAKSNAERESLHIREEARRAGHQEGLAEGMTEGQKAGHDEALGIYSQALKDVAARWTQTLDILHQNMPAHVADAKVDLVRLAIAIAERVTHQEALQNRGVAEATVAETLKMVGQTRTVVLLIHPDELEAIETYLPDLLAKIRTIESVELTPDPSITPGGCVVRFGAGEVDARIETQLKRIADELLASE
jgi:flagellar assembly protein FliH